MKTIIHTADIARPREAVFGALTTVPALSAWWTTKVTGDAGPGGRLSFTFAGDFNPVMQVVGFAAPAQLEWECVDGVEQWRDNTFRFDLADRHERHRRAGHPGVGEDALTLGLLARSIAPRDCHIHALPGARRTRHALPAILGQVGREWQLSRKRHQRLHQEHLAGAAS